MTLELSEWVAEVAADYRWGGRQGVDRVAPGLEAATVVAAFADPDGVVHVRTAGDRPVAATLRAPKPMETECFGLVTAALHPVVCPADTEDRGGVVAALLDEVVAGAADEEVDLLVLRVDADDTDTLVAAQTAGFTVCEATTTWLADSHAAPVPPPPAPGIEVTVHEGDVSGALSPSEVADLARATSRWELNHFRADPLLAAAAVDRFYGQWVHNIASGAWSDCLSVARLDGRVVGVESEVTDRILLAATGTTLRICEWLIVLEEGRGAGQALMAAAGCHRPPGGRWHSWETQLRNTPTVRCIERTRIARPVRGGYTLHAWPRR